MYDDFLCWKLTQQRLSKLKVDLFTLFVEIIQVFFVAQKLAKHGKNISGM